MNVQSPLSSPIRQDGATQGISRRVCEVVAGWRYEDLPNDVVHTVKLFALDTFGVIGGAAKAPGIAELNGRLARWNRQGSATSLINKLKYSPPHAAMANGAAAHALDFDDMHDPARIHAFCITLPTMLAAAEDIGAVSGREFILTLAIGAELHARFGFTCFNSLGKGWHPTMTLGTLAAALGAGRLLGQNAEQLLNSLGLAFHQTCGSAQPMLDGVLAKRLGAGIACRNAVTAAYLASDGITGPFLPLEGSAGLFLLQERGEVRPEKLLEDIGQEWRIRGYAFKPYPCCRCNHTTIGLAIGLHERKLMSQDIAAVEVWLPQVNYQTVGQPYDAVRDSVVHAQFNAAYSFARALVDGRVDLHTYTRPNITDAAVVALANKVTVHSDPLEEPTDMGPSRVVVTLTSGKRIEVSERIVPSSPERPMSEADVLKKFCGCMEFGLGLGRDAVRSFAEQVLAIDELENVATLCSSFPAKVSERLPQ